MLTSAIIFNYYALGDSSLTPFSRMAQIRNCVASQYNHVKFYRRMFVQSRRFWFRAIWWRPRHMIHLAPAHYCWTCGSSLRSHRTRWSSTSTSASVTCRPCGTADWRWYVSAFHGASASSRSRTGASRPSEDWLPRDNLQACNSNSSTVKMIFIHHSVAATRLIEKKEKSYWFYFFNFFQEDH